MKMRRVFSLVMICLLLQLSAYMSIPAAAATALSITQPSNWAYLSKNSPGTLKWSKVTGAAGYTVTVKNDATGEYYTQNEWTTKTSYSLKSLFSDALTASEYPRLKIWVGAMKSTDISQGLIALDAQDSIIAVVSEEPDVTLDSITSITTRGATLTMTLSKDYGSAIIDSGFYVGTSSETTAMTKYSFSSYGTATTKGTKTMTITGLQDGTKYYVKAYAKNSVDEAETTPKSFTTTATTVPLSISTNSVSWDYGSGNESEITVTCSGTYSCKIEYALSDQESSGYDYEWLDYEISGNSLWLRPERTNYYAKSRTAKVTVTCGSENKEITVTQGACGEDEPKIEIKQGSSLSSLSTVPNGTNWGNYSAEGTDTLYLYAGIKNVRRITVNIKKVGDLYSVNSKTFTHNTTTGNVACFVPVSDKDGNGLPAGEYQVDIWASNSVTENDYWAQKPNKITMFFDIQCSGTSSGEGNTEGASIGVDLTDERFEKMEGYTETVYYDKLKSIVLSGQYIDDIVNVAITQNGNTENANGQSVYGLFYGNQNSGIDGSWCAYFVSWCSGRANIPVDIISLSSTANPGQLVPNGEIGMLISQLTYNNHYESWKTQTRPNGELSFPWLKDDRTKRVDINTYIPQKGDLIFFGTTGSTLTFTHVGLVIADSDGKTFSYIDGNGGSNGADNVSIQTNCGITTWGIIAYARPNYTKETHIHTYSSGPYYDSEHPHKECMICSCGDKFYTGATKKLDNCTECKTSTPICVHAWVVVGTDSEGSTINRCTKCGVEMNSIEHNKPEADQSFVIIIFDAGAGSDAPDNISTKTGAIITIPTEEPIRSGYTFLGWDTSADATTAEYQAGDSYTVTGGVTFYAVWQKNSSSGGSGGGSSAPAEKYVFNLVNSSGSSATVSVTNNTGYKVSARLLIAAYDSSNKMIGCSVAEKTWNNGTNAEIALTCGSRISYVKVFILDINTNAPLFKFWQKTL